MNKATAVFRWINAVRANHCLRAGSCVRVALQLVENISGAEFAASGQMVTWQSLPRLAAATGLQVRTVRYVLRRLEATGFISTDAGGGRGRSNHYTLTLPETRQANARFKSDKPGKPVPGLDSEARQSHVVNPAKPRRKSRHGRSGETTKETLPKLGDDRESGDSHAPRRRADALGARPNGHEGQQGKGLSEGKPDVLPEPDGISDPADAPGVLSEPGNTFGARLRRQIADPKQFVSWFESGEVALISVVGDVVTLSAKNRFFAYEIANRFESAILRCVPGALWLKVVVRPTVAAEVSP
ncbi:hypothetical protein JQ627_38150 [Bradyrhizobium liaoningense]|nr:hypothetical protein [Bradyrhizobium liaoningense]MBR0823746.1 hypothetical protein [Bradyrhizobium liaoningense]